jgi:parallel beta-helix repeat protein
MSFCTLEALEKFTGNRVCSNVIWVPDNFTTIQGAINGAKPGDTIVVRNGTYYENVRVNKTVRLIGEDFPIVDGSYWNGLWGFRTLSVAASNVTVSGFIIEHSLYRKEDDHGVWVGSDNNNITGNIIRRNVYSVYVGYGTQGNYVTNNTIQQSSQGILCIGNNHHIVGNNVSYNWDGIYVSDTINTLINNTVAWNYNFGIDLGAYEVTLRRNNMTGNRLNFITWESVLSQLVNDIDTSNTINGKPMYYWINQSDKTVPSDAGYVAVINSTNITVEGLNLTNNGQGILVAYSSNVTVENCNLTSNWWGVRLLSSSNVSIYHNNIIDNYIQYETNSENLWDDGYPSGGNYWSDYTGMDEKGGLYQNETGSDGVGDTAYGQDRYPLMAPFKRFNASWKERTFPVDTVSNSTISSLKFSQETMSVSFNVATNSSVGFSRVTIPTQLLWCNTPNEWQVLADGIPIEHTILETLNNTYIYFTYSNSTEIIEIKSTYTIPEFKPLMLLPFLLTIITIIAILKPKKKKHKSTPSYKSEMMYKHEK